VELAAAARRLAERHQAAYQEWVGEVLLAANFPAIHAVGRASSEAPRLLELRWTPRAGQTYPRLTLVGKGVCFDSGGLDIKSGSGMALMKKDMGGAAVALALAHLLMSTGVRAELRVLIPAVENAISGDAYRPGDVLTTRKGLTVEVGNTDAEGRLVLCDALALADAELPDLIIDFATLTGAARVALFLLGCFLTALVIGLLVCALVLLWGTRAETSAWAAVNFFVMLSGIYYPVSVLPEWVQTVSAGIPLTYFLDGIRAGYGFPPRFAHPFAMGLALVGLYVVLAHWALAAAVTRARRTGLLLKLSE